MKCTLKCEIFKYIQCLIELFKNKLKISRIFFKFEEGRLRLEAFFWLVYLNNNIT